MRGLKKLALAAFLTSAVAGGMSATPARANEFPTQNPIASEYNKYDWHVILVKATLIADDLKTKISDLWHNFQIIQDSFPELTFIMHIVPPNGGYQDRIGDDKNAAGGTSAPTTAIAWIIDILDIDTSGVVKSVKLKEEYRNKAIELFEESKTAELENALSNLFSNNVDVYRVVMIDENQNRIESVPESNPVPEWINSLDGKYVYMLVMLVYTVSGITPQQAGEYKSTWDSLYREILYNNYLLGCAEKAVGLAEWLEKNADNPDIPDEIKQEKYNELQELLKPLGINLN